MIVREKLFNLENLIVGAFKNKCDYFTSIKSCCNFMLHISFKYMNKIYVIYKLIFDNADYVCFEKMQKPIQRSKDVLERNNVKCFNFLNMCVYLASLL